jgi:aminoglycoside/choline kinase family phosphotransferase
MNLIFSTSAKKRLGKYLENKFSDYQVQQLTPDASTREFFRIKLTDRTQIACIYAENFDQNLPQIDVTNLFLKCDLPVAQIIDVDFENGIVIHEDFGDSILRDYLENNSQEKGELLLNKAMFLIAQIQASTEQAFALNSISSKLKFDKEKLLWELNFFLTHYFGSLLKKPLNPNRSREINIDFEELSRELEERATVLTHRDFHSANLMLGQNNDLKIIDHQDARIGSVAYDLVSLLLDRITIIPDENWLKEKKLFFLSRRKSLCSAEITYSDFNYEFDLITVQRCLKAIGTFSNQAGNFGKPHFIKYIDPMFQVVLESCQRLNRFPNIQEMIRKT